MAKLSSTKRARLPASSFACPKTRSYPINDAAHVRNALSRYRQPRTEKCRGGLKRICRRANRLGIYSSVCR